MTDVLRVGTRGSPLALAQTAEVVARLHAAHPDIAVETVPIRTHGDDGLREDRGTALDGKRAFTKRIEDALLDGRIDFAVHSLKDLPTDHVPGLAVAALPRRSDPRDVLVSNEGHGSADLGPGVRVGTSSLRRRAQLLARWPGLAVSELHGNVGTRLRRLDAREYDAVVVAAAGLHRLQLQDRIAEPLDPDVVTPAPGQGALAVEARTEDPRVIKLLAGIDDPACRRATEAERDLSARVGGGCNVPFGALAELHGRRILLRAMVASPDGARLLRARAEGLADDWRLVVNAVWKDLRAGGADDILAEAT